jgi:hypothetical protein
LPVDTIINLVENKEEIAAGSIDVVQQHICGNRIFFIVPLGEQLCKKARGECVQKTASEYNGVEGFARDRYTIKLVLWSETQVPIRLKFGSNLETASRPVEEISRIQAKIPGNLERFIGGNPSPIGREMVFSRRND